MKRYDEKQEKERRVGMIRMQVMKCFREKNMKRERKREWNIKNGSQEEKKTKRKSVIYTRERKREWNVKNER